MKTLIVIFLISHFVSCSDDSTIVEKDVLFEYTERTISRFYIESSTKAINIENPFGYVAVSGGPDSIEVEYVLDKSVKAENSTLSQSAFDKIYLNSTLEDTILCEIISSTDDFSLKCNLNLITPYHKPIIVRNSNGGVSVSNLYSDIYVETENYDCTVNRHNGSLEAHSTTGNISSSIYLPKTGYCICYSESGDIYIEIPNNSSLNIHMKTESGTITYTNLDIDIISTSKNEFKGSLSTGRGNIYLESKKGNIILKGVGEAHLKDFTIEDIKKEWIHSREEETDSLKIYRPSDFKDFPTSWYRQKYKFEDSNLCKYFVLSPTDAHYYKDGTWAFNEDMETITIFDLEDQIIVTYKIEALSSTLLKLREIR